jgi:hypothetical protein
MSASGDWFDLARFDVAGTFLQSAANVTRLRVEGTLGTGGSVVAEVDIADPDKFETKFLTGFMGLTEVIFTPLNVADPDCTNCPEFQLDNLHAEIQGPIVLMPEPATSALMAGCLALIAGLRTRHRRG